MSYKILVIKLGAFGDFVQAMGAFSAIRKYHYDSELVLMTSSYLAEFAACTPWFDEVWVDEKPKLYNIGGIFRLRNRLKKANLTRIYDLQTSYRSSLYYRAFWPAPAPEWSGISPGCSHFHSNPERNNLHTVDRLEDQLLEAGVMLPSPPDFSWVNKDISKFKISGSYAILVPGGAKHRPGKRWSKEHYRSLAEKLNNKGIIPVVIGTELERGLGEFILEKIDSGINMAGITSIYDLCALGANALITIGNDTGPMHLFGAQNTPAVVLFSNASDPKLCGQRGQNVTILQRENLQDLDVDVVMNIVSQVNHT